MTTAETPTHILKAQADKIAKTLKSSAAQQPNVTGLALGVTLPENVTFAVVMDDKVLKLTMPWATIREKAEAEVSGFILKQMQGI